MYRESRHSLQPAVWMDAEKNTKLYILGPFGGLWRFRYNITNVSDAGPKCVAAVPTTTISDTLFVFSFPEADVTSRAERPVLSPERDVLKMRHELTTKVAFVVNSSPTLGKEEQRLQYPGESSDLSPYPLHDYFHTEGKRATSRFNFATSAPKRLRLSGAGCRGIVNNRRIKGAGLSVV